jgi:hypothetical protein
MRVAMATQDAGDEDRFRVQKMIKEVGILMVFLNLFF